MKPFFISFLLLSITALLYVQHIGTVIKAPVTEKESIGPVGVFIEKNETSHRHVILEGSDFHRGAEFGRLMKEKLVVQEDLMVSKLDGFIGNSLAQSVFFAAAMIWFHDVDKYLDSASLKEMQGVSVWSPKKFDYLADGFTRQIAYHGLHEVGQMFVDEDRVDMGCFATVLQTENKNWVIGRNFDFDVDGFFDKEKVLKWVFPEGGIPHLSIIWAGMVGAVTGVNQDGLFVSINAAGSDDFARVGTPTTMIVKNILTHAHNIPEAVKILENAQVFITDIFLLVDRKNNQVAIVEKSPKRMSVTYPDRSVVVSNHLLNDIWKGDKNNHNRTVNLTSESRYIRGLELIQNPESDEVVYTSKMLRDMKLPKNRASHIGNRGAIDSFIASQSVIFDSNKNVLFVNLGPGTQGKYLGYDLAESFGQKRPVVKSELPAGFFTQVQYDKWQERMLEVTKAKSLVTKDCSKVKELLSSISAPDFVHYDKERLLGDYADICLKDNALAVSHWKAALDFNPPYAKQRAYLEEKIK